MAREATMTRKHYEAIASAINTMDIGCYSRHNAAACREYIAHDFAKLFASMDHTFNTELFLAGALKGDRKRAKLTMIAGTGM